MSTSFYMERTFCWNGKARYRLENNYIGLSQIIMYTEKKVWQHKLEFWLKMDK